MNYAFNLQDVKKSVNYADLIDKKDKLEHKLKVKLKTRPKKIKPGIDIGPTVGC